MPSPLVVLTGGTEIYAVNYLCNALLPEVTHHDENLK